MTGNANSTMSDQAPDSYNFTQTGPLNLSDYQGADHRGKVRLKFDRSTLPTDAPEDVGDDIDWMIRALNAVVYHPNLVLWIRTRSNDLLIAHHPHEDHEQAGHLRAATFHQDHRPSINLSLKTETECGIITPFAAINAIYDQVVNGTYDYSVVLSEIMYLEDWFDPLNHPIIDLNDHLTDWGREQLIRSTYNYPTERDKTAYSEPAYDGTCPTGDLFEEHGHAVKILHEHIEHFMINK